jgi:nitroreductase
MVYHSLEKGLAMRDCRPGFGQDKAMLLIRSLDLYLSRYPECDEVKNSIKVLQAYSDFHEDRALLDRELLQNLQRIIGNHASKEDVPGGTRDRTKQEVLAASQKDLMDFFQSRHSIRHFAETEVPDDLIRQAAIMAQCSPSVCNRQACRIHIFRKGEFAEDILEVQGGNRGFGDQADKIAVVTVDLSWFLSVSERNQGWVDGGLFAMTFAWGLHSLGVGTCFLNWSAECEKDQRMRDLIKLPREESIITFMAIGSLPEKFKVAASPRCKPETVLVFHEE